MKDDDGFPSVETNGTQLLAKVSAADTEGSTRSQIIHTYLLAERSLHMHKRRYDTEGAAD